MSFSIVVACTTKGGIAYRNRIPWHIPEDMRHFQALTTNTAAPQSDKINAVIMGRNTWDSLSKKPLKNRRNVVLSKSGTDIRSCEVYSSFDAALSVLTHDAQVENIFVIGGEGVYREALAHPLCKRVYLTLIDINCECDKFFPIEDLFGNWAVSSVSAPFNINDDDYFAFVEYEKNNQEQLP